MKVSYNLIAGQSLERIAALSDGVFAIAMTLLVLDLRVPKLDTVQSEQALWTALVALAPRLLTYGVSFLTLGIFWVGQQTQLNHFQKSNRDMAWIHLIFLAAVSLMPFSTGLLAEFITYRLALFIYWLNLLLLGVMLLLSWNYAYRAKLLKETVTEEMCVAAERRILVYQLLYFTGLLFSLINTYVSIGFIVLIQLNAALAPRFRR